MQLCKIKDTPFNEEQLIITSTLIIVGVSSAVQRVEFTPDRGTALSFSSSPSTGLRCKVCTRVKNKRQCEAVQKFSSGPVSVELECFERYGPFNVEVFRTIDCTTKSCSDDIQTNTKFDSLSSLNRNFVWNLTASSPKAASLDFGKTGLRQIRPSESCPDKHSFSYEVFQESGKVLVGKYCNSGPITRAQALGFSRFSLEVPAEQKLQSINFDVSNGEDIKSMAKISVSLPQGLSSLELFSPNYPGSFPDDDVMEWYFEVPEKHKATVQLFNLTEPRCLRKEAAVEYHRLARHSLLVGLREAQPEQREGGFTMTLRNCRMDRRRAGSPGLATNFRVSASKASSQVQCEVDLRKLPGVSLHLKKLSPPCVMKQKSVAVDQTTLVPESVTQMSFESCLAKDIQVTASKKIECSQARTCQKVPLSIPPLPQCLPAPLSNMTWALRLSKHGTVELGCSSGPLRRELPGQPCNDTISMKIAEDDGSTIGTFCRNGSITKLQIHSNMTITVSGTNGSILMPSHILTARIKEEISERYIFRVSPNKNTPLFMATPGWPKGMSPYSTVSWIVTVPPKMEAHVRFVDLKQPKCSNRHTNMRIQRVGSLEEEYSRREDETPEDQITVSESFYLNMSNCLPERGDFSVLTQVTLKKSQLMTIILAVVAALLVVFIAVLVVVCLVIRKKKKRLTQQVSIYNPNGTSFLPGQNGFPKSHEEDEYHVYEDIEDTLVYTHLLRKGAQMGIYGEFDSKQEAGRTDSQKPLVERESGAGDIEVDRYQEFPQQDRPKLPQRPPSHAQPMVDNDLYEAGGSGGERSPSLGPRLDPEGGEHSS